MNKNLVRKLFEEHTVPNFSWGETKVLYNQNGTYTNPAIEDHWQTFQEAVELTVKESIKALWTEECYASDLAVEEYFPAVQS